MCLVEQHSEGSGETRSFTVTHFLPHANNTQTHTARLGIVCHAALSADVMPSPSAVLPKCVYVILYSMCVGLFPCSVSDDREEMCVISSVLLEKITMVISEAF